MKGTIFALLLSVAALVATPLEAQNVPRGCWPDREAMTQQLSSEKYGETQMFSGVSTKYAPRGVVGIEFWVNPDAGNFTYVFEHSNGLFCIGDAGEGFTFGPTEVEEEGDPA